MKSFLLFASIYVCSITLAAQNNAVSYIQYTYWKITTYGNNVFKSKSLVLMDKNTSVQQTVYIVPQGANDTTAILREKRETYTNQEGKNVDKITLNAGPTKAYAPQNMYGYYKSANTLLQKTKVLFAGGNGNGDEYILEEKNLDFGWQITEERKKIGDWECVKAVSKPFRGRVYMAWFAPEIPISNGPWKLGGLPGLILEAEDQTGEVFFAFESIVINPTTRPVIHNPYENVKLPRISWQEYVKKVKAEDLKASKMAESKGVRVIHPKKYSVEIIE